jgi:hypothetical protein
MPDKQSLVDAPTHASAGGLAMEEEHRGTLWVTVLL